MIIADLIKKLGNYNPNLEVVVRDYERGYTKVEDKLFWEGYTILNPDKTEGRWYYGDYEDSKNGTPSLFIDYTKADQ